MFIKEIITGGAQCKSILCRSRLDQSILLFVSLSVLTYSWYEHEISDVPVFSGFKFWAGIVMLLIVLISYLDFGLKKLMLSTMNRIPFIVIPGMLANLYLKSLEPYFMMFFISTYIALSFLIDSKKGVRAYITIMTIGVIVILNLVSESMMHESMVLFTFIFSSGLIWIVGSEFIWNYKRLAKELNRAQELNYLHSHKLRAPVARIIGLNQLIEMGDSSAYRLLINEIKSIDIELTNIQTVFDSPKVFEEKPIKLSKSMLSPVEYTLLVMEVIFLVNILFFI